jgi:hypothetical protein
MVSNMARTKTILGLEVPASMHALYKRTYINVNTESPTRADLDVSGCGKESNFDFAGVVSLTLIGMSHLCNPRPSDRRLQLGFAGLGSMISNMGLRLGDVLGAYSEAYPDGMHYTCMEDALNIRTHPDYTYLPGWAFWERMILVAHMGSMVARGYDLDQLWARGGGEDVPTFLRSPIVQLLSLEGYDGNGG